MERSSIIDGDMFSALRPFIARPARCLNAPAPACTICRYTTRSARSILDDDSTPVDLSEDNDAVDGVRSTNPRRNPSSEKTPSTWQVHRSAIKEAFPDGWNPPRKLSREAMEGLRQLNRVDPETFTTPVLAERFRVSPEAVRRILKSRWTPPVERRAKLLKKEADAKAEFLSLRALKERMETRRVMESRMDMREARRMDAFELDGGEEGIETQSDEDDAPRRAPVRGVHARDRLTFQ
ncbi:putative neugrin-like protein [Favolaschia claudopus]|uniref:Required for respiratory growth protein 9, mitochondrial n=1 Tax=Favolaschia claudopus TaxID=2862362 RepID=A0AAW0CK47_9AGAR